jgi:hypothetical protein
MYVCMSQELFIDKTKLNNSQVINAERLVGEAMISQV